MKKLVKTLEASLLALSAIALFSCGSDGDEYEYNANEVVEVKLSTPSVDGKSYNGVNYIWWSAVPNARSYSLYRNGERIDYSGSDCFYEDSNVSNAGDYKYEVIAKGEGVTTISDTIAKKALDSDRGSKTLAVSFPSGTDYDKSVLSSLGAKSNYGSSSDVKLEKGASGTYYVSFPGKVWLSYKVYIVDKNKVEANSYNTSLFSSADASFDPSLYTSDDVKGGYTKGIDITDAGEKVAVVEASATNKSQNYGDIYVVSSNSITVDEISALSAGTIQALTYVDTASAKARLVWKAAELSSGDYAAASNYVVYRQNKKTNSYEKISAAVTSAAEKGVYYVDDTVPSTEIDYTYYVVLTDGTNYGKESLTASLNAVTAGTVTDPSSVSVDKKALDEDGVVNDAYITFIPADQTSVAVSYAEVPEDAVTYVESSSITEDQKKIFYDTLSYTAITTTPGNYSVDNYGYVPNLTAGSTYVFKFVATDLSGKGKESSTTFETLSIDEAAFTVPTFSVEGTDSWSSTEKSVSRYIQISDTKTDGYTYTLYKAAYSWLDDSKTVYALENYSKLYDISLFEYQDGVYVAEYTDTLTAEGVYSYYVEKKNSAGDVKRVYASTTVSSADVGTVYDLVINSVSISGTEAAINFGNSVSANNNKDEYFNTFVKNVAVYRAEVSAATNGYYKGNYTKANVTLPTAAAATYEVKDTVEANKHYSYVLIATVTYNGKTYTEFSDVETK